MKRMLGTLLLLGSLAAPLVQPVAAYADDHHEDRRERRDHERRERREREARERREREARYRYGYRGDERR